MAWLAFIHTDMFGKVGPRLSELTPRKEEAMTVDHATFIPPFGPSLYIPTNYPQTKTTNIHDFLADRRRRLGAVGVVPGARILGGVAGSSSASSEKDPGKYKIKKISSRIYDVEHFQFTYKVSHLLVDMYWFDFHISVSNAYLPCRFCKTPISPQAEELSNSENPSQLNPVHELMRRLVNMSRFCIVRVKVPRTTRTFGDFSSRLQAIFAQKEQTETEDDKDYEEEDEEEVKQGWSKRLVLGCENSPPQPEEGSTEHHANQMKSNLFSLQIAIIISLQ